MVGLVSYQTARSTTLIFFTEPGTSFVGDHLHHQAISDDSEKKQGNNTKKRNELNIGVSKNRGTPK